MRKNVLSLSISAMLGGLGFAAAGAEPRQWFTGVCAHELQPFVRTWVVAGVRVIDMPPIRVRFRGASKNDDTLDFDVFTAPERRA